MPYPKTGPALKYYALVQYGTEEQISINNSMNNKGTF